MSGTYAPITELVTINGTVVGWVEGTPRIPNGVMHPSHMPAAPYAYDWSAGLGSEIDYKGVRVWPATGMFRSKREARAAVIEAAR